ncbi:MAG: NAD(P)-binding protein [Burkholderiales bacterium]|nr:NAD(P)-binding protein [Burkholderiales bacterium]
MSSYVDMTTPPDLTKRKGTGPVRTKFPVWVNTMPPCNHACPAGSNVQAWLALAQEERYEEAFQELIRNNPMPAIHGRVCYHPCETKCNRAQVDEAVNIHAVERFLGDLALERGWTVRNIGRPTGKRVLIIGGGPSGLAAAYHLRLSGHEVEIHESGNKAGGMMRFGIPAYRLPRRVLDEEIERIAEMGVKIVTNHLVTDLLDEKERGRFDAVFIAIGAHKGNKVDIPARDAGKVVDAIDYLREIELDVAPKLGKRVVVYGGGNTAMDAARTIRRLGSEVKVVYRRDRAHMPAHDFECAEAMEEGVAFLWLRTINQIEETVFTLERMELNDEGRPQPTGVFETIEADSLVLALGQNIDTLLTTKISDVKYKKDGTVIVNDQMMTGYHGLFAGGDMIPSERTVTTAVGHGKKAARHIDAFLKGIRFQKLPTIPKVNTGQLHLWYKTDAAQAGQPVISLKQRESSFDEVMGGLNTEEAHYEAQRCYSCGNCFECNGCFGACPQDAVIRLGKGKGYQVDFDKCTGCEACYLQCPCHAIEMVAQAA